MTPMTANRCICTRKTTGSYLKMKQVGCATAYGHTHSCFCLVACHLSRVWTTDYAAISSSARTIDKQDWACNTAFEKLLQGTSRQGILARHSTVKVGVGVEVQGAFLTQDLVLMFSLSSSARSVCPSGWPAHCIYLQVPCLSCCSAPSQYRAPWARRSLARWSAMMASCTQVSTTALLVGGQLAP